jgi:ribose transport system permease protein
MSDVRMPLEGREVALDPDARRARFRSVAGDFAYKYALIVAWVLVGVVFSILRPNTFATTANIKTIFASQSVLLVLALGVVLPLIVGEFDLSIASVLGFSAILIAVLNVNDGWPIWGAVVLAIAVGPVIGLLNGFFVVVVGVDALIATLGVGTFITGIGYAISNYTTIPNISTQLVNAVTTNVLGLPLSFYYAIGLGIVLWYVLRYTPTGRHMLFVGEGRDVARLSGLPVQRIRLGAFVVCGLVSAFAGAILAGTLGSADPNASVSYLLPAYAAAFLGSTAIVPGQFNAWGTIVAVYFLITGITGLQLMGLRDWIQDVFYGGSLVFAVTLSRLAARRRAT